MPRQRLARLPPLLERKLYKTGQTRGADDDVIYQNRVARNSTVLIPYGSWAVCSRPADGTDAYENGFIVLVSPSDYFDRGGFQADMARQGLTLGVNALVFYETREQWNAHNPEAMRWHAASRRRDPLGGQYVARVPATTAEDGGRIIRGFNVTAMKGAGIRVYEYASQDTIAKCRRQLEMLYWLCADALDVATSNGMDVQSAGNRRDAILQQCHADGLDNRDTLYAARILNRAGVTICPLCLEELSAQGFFNRMEQAEGREVPDLTITQLNLFHVEELRYGSLGHRPYNIGWGHHHCNVVTKDSGILQTLQWMQDVIGRNIQNGYLRG